MTTTMHDEALLILGDLASSAENWLADTNAFINVSDDERREVARMLRDSITSLIEEAEAAAGQLCLTPLFHLYRLITAIRTSANTLPLSVDTLDSIQDCQLRLFTKLHELLTATDGMLIAAMNRGREL